jgi:hypothetical protein
VTLMMPCVTIVSIVFRTLLLVAFVVLRAIEYPKIESASATVESTTSVSGNAIGIGKVIRYRDDTGSASIRIRRGRGG